MQQHATTSTPQVDFNLLKDYYDAYFRTLEEPINGFDYIKEFKALHPVEYKYFNSVHHKRSKVRKNIDYLASLNKSMYFGTLTFKNSKDKNKIAYKRREAFNVLNELFCAFLLVEEEGEKNKRYHVHFVGVFKDGYGFDDFIKAWHSRQNIEEVKDFKKVSSYLVKYVSKSLPRIRRNKGLVALSVRYEKIKRISKHFSAEAVASLYPNGYNVFASD